MLAYLGAFCAGDVDRLESLIGGGFRFAGPFARFDSRRAYIEALRAGPPEPASSGLLDPVEQAGRVAAFYVHRKPGVETAMAQWFAWREGRIVGTLRVFDGRAFA